MRTLRQQFNVATLVIFCLATVILSFAARLITTRAVEAETDGAALRSASLLSAALVPMLAVSDLGSIDELTRELVSRDDFLYVTVIDTRGKQISSAGDTDGKDRKDYVFPLQVAEQAYGEVRFGISRQGITAASDQVFWRLIVVCTVTLICGAALMLQLARRMTRQLDALGDSTRRMAAGETSVRVVVEGDNELSRLAQAFNVMANALDERIAALAHAERVLEDRVTTRTQDLATSNASLANAIDDLKRLQDELVEREKLASLGSLVAGVAHELNTPIGNALLAASTLLNDLSDLENKRNNGNLTKRQFDEYIAHAKSGMSLTERNLHRAAALVRNFKQVAVDQTSDVRRPFKLSECVHEIVALHSPQFLRSGHVIEVQVSNTIEMDGYPGALGQVVGNLIANAFIHAFESLAPGQGKVCIKASLENDDSICMSIEDNGSGIPRDLQRRIFEPFFTTRLGQGGSGLGLHIAYSLVTSTFGGRLTVHSEQSKGTRFEIRIPRTVPAQFKTAETQPQ